MTRRAFSVVAIAALVLMLTVSAHATTVIDFAGSGTGGDLSISGGNATGTFAINTLTVSGAPMGNGVYAVSDSLYFNTLSNLVTLTGAVPQLGIGSGTLATGSFSSVNVNPGYVLGIVYGAGPDTKSALLLTALGLSADTQFQFFGFDISTNTKFSGSPYTSTYSVDLINTQIPEPGTLTLFGSGLIGLAVLFRRKIVQA